MQRDQGPSQMLDRLPVFEKELGNAALPVLKAGAERPVLNEALDARTRDAEDIGHFVVAEPSQ